MIKHSLIVLGVGLTLSLLLFGARSQDTEFSAFVDADGNIELPIDFRKNMVHLGSWFVPEGDASGFHDVYTEASSVEAYRRTGKFLDGATLVKELRPNRAGDYTTARGWKSHWSRIGSGG